MVSKNNFQKHQEQLAKRKPHYGIRKLSVGVASVLLSTTMYLGVSANTANADTTNNGNTQTDQVDPQKEKSSLSSTSVTLNSANTNAGSEKAATPSAEKTNTAATSTEKTGTDAASSSSASTVSTDVEKAATDAANASSASTAATSTEKAVTDTASSEKANMVVPNAVVPNAEKAVTEPANSEKPSADAPNTVVPSSENKTTTTTNTNSAPTAPKRVVRSLAATPTTNSNELVENKDYTVSNVSLEDHKKQDNFDEDATFLHADINLKDGNAIANKQITFTFNSKEFRGFETLKKQDLTYNDQVIGNIVAVGDWNRTFKIAFNDKTKGLKDINLSLKLYLKSDPYALKDLYTNNQAKDNKKYTVRYNYQIGSTNYYVDRESTIHYAAEKPQWTNTNDQYYREIGYYYAYGAPDGWTPWRPWLPVLLISLPAGRR